MKKSLLYPPRLFAIPLGLLALVSSSHAQLSLRGNVEADVTTFSSTGGASYVAKYAHTPPGYTNTGAITHGGTGIFTSAFTVQAKKSTGSATLLYRPSLGTADPLNSFSGIQSTETLGLGSLKLTDTTLAAGTGSVSFTLNVEFASLQLFDGSTAVTSLFTSVPIFSLPLKLTLQSAGSVATLALAAPYSPTTMFNSLVLLDHGYKLDLAPAFTFDTLIGALSSGVFKANPTHPFNYGTIDIVPTIISPVPEASTYGLGAAALLLGFVVRRRFRSACPAASGA